MPGIPQLTEIGQGVDSAAASMAMATSVWDGVKAPVAMVKIVCRDENGVERWRETAHNLVLTAGKTLLVDTFLKGSAYTAAWYLLLKGAGSIAAGDTLASHAGWSEVTPYAGNRPAITWGTTASGSNTSSGVVVTMNATATVAGCGICTVASGTSGTLYNAVDFASARSVVSSDTLTVTMTIGMS